MAFPTRAPCKALLSSNPNTSDKLPELCPKCTEPSLDMIAQYFGLDTERAVTDWFESPAFRPFHDELWRDWIKSDGESKKAKEGTALQGPEYSMVKATLWRGEAHGDRKFSKFKGDKTDWLEEDHYALCLWQLTDYAMFDRPGNFRLKSVVMDDVYSRMWVAITRGNMVAGRKANDLAQKLQKVKDDKERD